MTRRLSREQLIDVARKLMTADVESDEDSNRLGTLWNDNIPHPAGTDLIFYPEREFATPEELVDYALSYKANE